MLPSSVVNSLSQQAIWTRTLVLLACGSQIMLEPTQAQTSREVIGRERLDQKPATIPKTTAPPVVGKPTPYESEALTPFVLKRVVLDNSSLSPAVIQSVSRSFIGRQVDSALLTELAGALAKAYANSYVALYNVSVPPQSPSNGILHVTAVEGFISDIEIRGIRKTRVKRAIEAYARPLMQERPLSKASLERLNGLLADQPGLSATLGAISDPVSGATRLIVSATSRSVSASLNIDRRGIALLGRTIAQFDIQANSVLTGADQLRLTVLSTVADDNIQFQGASYQRPLDRHGTTLTASAGRQRTRYTILPLEGRSESFGLQISHPLLRRQRQALSVSIGIDGINSENALLGYILSSDRIRAVRLAGSYSVTDTHRLFSIGVTASAGLSALGARTMPGQAVTDFRKLSWKASASQAVGAHAAVRVALFGQWTGDDLPSSEQIALGGSEFGRAYAASSIGGDTGNAASAELAWRPASLPALIAGSELYLFADAGRVRTRSRYGLPAERSALASVGTGARLLLGKRHVLEIEAAQGLCDPIFYAPGRTRLTANLRLSL